MAWSCEYRAFVVEEFIQNGCSPIMTQRGFRIRLALGRRDPVPDEKNHNWVSSMLRVKYLWQFKHTHLYAVCSTGMKDCWLICFFATFVFEK
jgi:hypothetical protein